MRNWCFLIFFSCGICAQNPALQIQIDSISSSDSNKTKRKFTIHYHIQNNSNKSVSFFLNPNTLIANAAASMTLFPVYKIYHNGQFEDMDGPFFENEIPERDQLDDFDDYNSPAAKEFIQKTNYKYQKEYEEALRNYKASGATSTDNLWIYNNYKQMKSVVTLQPKETRSFTINTSWDKVRTVYNGDYEYYLDETGHYEIELTIDLKTTAFKEQLTDEQFKRIERDQNYIEGSFVSNKAEINFK